MMTKRVPAAGVAIAGVLGAAYLASAAMAQEENPPAEMPPMLTAEQVKAIWPAGLQKIAGRYTFAQVASPGGFWERTETRDGASQMRQVSLNEVPAAFRKRLTTAEIEISDLQLPTQIEASQRESPSKRGMLRFYSEATICTLRVKNLPGMSGRDDDGGSFSGKALLQLGHQSHSNPSVSGVLQQRQQTEATWGAATLDYADLSASTTPPPLKEGAEAVPVTKLVTAPEKKAPTPLKPTAPGAGKAKSEAPKALDKDRPDPDEHLEGESIIANARVLRSGVEIFAFVEWETRTPKGHLRTYGTVRLVKVDSGAPPVNPQPAPPLSNSTE